MSKIVLISCVSKKLSHKAKAKDMYISPLFKFNLKYARTLNPDTIYILSAKYGLLDIEAEINPYDLTLNNLSSKDIQFWAENVMNKLVKLINPKTDEVVFLAGERYRRYLIPHLGNYRIPLKGLGIGRQLKYLKEATK